jgi:hypothetical protein
VWANKTWLPLATLKGHDNKVKCLYFYFFKMSGVVDPAWFRSDFDRVDSALQKEKKVKFALMAGGYSCTHSLDVLRGGPGMIVMQFFFKFFLNF